MLSYKWISRICLVLGALLLGVSIPMFEQVLSRTLVQGGTLAGLSFLAMLVIAGVGFLGAALHFRRKARRQGQQNKFGR